MPNPGRSTLFDLSVAQYQTFAEAEANPVRVDMFFPESTQPQDIFDNPVGQTTDNNVFQAIYDLGGTLTVTPGQTNYLGISSTGVPPGIDYQAQRSDDSGIVVGSAGDYVSGRILKPGLFPMSQFYTDAIQNSIQITVVPCCKCEFAVGDVNQDGSVDLLDVAPFVSMLTGGDYQCEADVNQDGSVDLLDVESFVSLLAGD